MNKLTTKDFSIQIMIGAVYTVVSLVLPMLSFGPLQIRFAELLCLLPLFGRKHILGVVLGCFLTNLIGAMMGVNILGYVDVIVGTFATYLSLELVFIFRKLTIKKNPVISMWMPALINGLIIGAELAYVITPEAFMLGWLVNGFYIFVAEAIICFGIGIIIYPKLKDSRLFTQTI